MGLYGFSDENLSAYFGGMPIDQVQALERAATGQAPLPSDYAIFQQWQQSPGQLPNIEAGLGYLSQHPSGSRYHGDVNVGDLVGDLATMGQYSLFKNLAKGNVGGAIGSLNPAGNIAGDIGGPTAKRNVNLGTGAALGAYGLYGGFAGVEPSVVEASGAYQAQPVATLNSEITAQSLIPGAAGPQLSTGVAPFAANPAFAASGGAAVGGQFGAPAYAGAQFAGGSSGLSSDALLKAYLASGLVNQFGGLFGPRVQPGGQPTSPTGISGAQAQGLTAQQLAALTASQTTEPYKGLAPDYLARQRQQQERTNTMSNYLARMQGTDQTGLSALQNLQA